MRQHSKNRINMLKASPLSLSTGELSWMGGPCSQPALGACSTTVADTTSESQMTEQERQRTIDFILRSQGDAVIRQERWEERMEERVGRWEERFERDMEKLRAEVREFAKAAHETLKATEKLARENREHERRI